VRCVLNLRRQVNTSETIRGEKDEEDEEKDDIKYELTVELKTILATGSSKDQTNSRGCP
jgi:hypothetical protein